MFSRLQTVCGLALIPALLLPALAHLGAGHLSARAEQALVQRQDSLLQSLRAAPPSPDLLVRLVAAQPEVRRVRLQEPDGRVLAQAGDAQALLEPLGPQDGTERGDGPMRRVEQALPLPGHPQARIEIGLSREAGRQMHDQAMLAALGLGGVQALLACAVLRVMGTRQRRRLAAIGEAADRLGQGRLDSRVGAAAGAGDADEIARTAARFDRMAQALAERQALLLQGEQRQRRILENILDGILTLDAGRRLRSVSPTAERILHRRADQLLGRPLSALLMPSGRQLLEDLLELADAQSLAEPIVVEALPTEGGTPLTLEMRLARLEGAASRDDDHHLVVIRDLLQS